MYIIWCRKSYAIIRASEYKHSWIKKAVQDMKTNGSISNKHRREWEMQDAQLGNKQFNEDKTHSKI